MTEELRELFINLYKILGGATIAIAILGFLGGAFIKNRLRRDIENLKNDLQRKLFEFQTKYVTLYEKQTESISNLYFHIVELDIAWSDAFVHTPKNPEELANRAAKFCELRTNALIYFQLNKIWLPKEIVDHMELHLKEFQFPSDSGMPYPEQYRTDETTDWPKYADAVTAWSNGKKFTLRAMLEDKVQKMLSVAETLRN